MFHQSLTPVAGSLLASAGGRHTGHRGAGHARGAAPARLAGVAGGPGRRAAHGHRLVGLSAGRWRSNAAAAGVVFAVWPVMWIVFAALLLYNVAVDFGPLRRISRLGVPASAGRPARRADRHRLLLRRAARRHFGLRNAHRHHLVAADPDRLARRIEALTFTLIFNTAPVAFGALGVPITVLGKGHRPAGRNARRHGRPAVAVLRAAAAVLCDGRLRRPALHRRAVASAAGRGRKLRTRAVRQSTSATTS